MLNTLQFILIRKSDILILALLVFVLVRISKKESKSETEEIRALKVSFEKSMHESEKVAKEMLTAFDSKINEFNDILSYLDEKVNHIRLDMLKAVEISEGLSKNAIQESSTEPYKKAVDMLAENIPVEDIQKASGLSLSEIDLIKQLSQNKIN